MIISEIGLNHVGEVKLLHHYLQAIKGTNVDAISVQVIKDEFYENDNYTKYKIEDTELIEFLKDVKNSGLKVGVAIDDISKVKKFDSVGMDFYKVLSKDLTNTDLINELLLTSAKSIYLSTGMSEYDDIDSLIKELAPLDDRIKLIHTQLSHAVNEVNMKAINVMRERYSLPIAYGHHCEVPEVIYVSIGYEPESVFFYIKGAGDIEYPDDTHAICVDEVSIWSSKIKSLQQAIGSGKKEKMKDWAVQ